ncbi:platelet glycoprotein Ib alpha chain [Melanotaenia boesemani]|uniref:platelet glycoprotein Ib alpha chain n=1 Tax=Melanotaenia boesemani TaxID=1250792 RepID=UPI001C03FB67|nr:platelet glycoprotein Ib alpha chain [Melanotaenia boesemani]
MQLFLLLTLLMSHVTMAAAVDGCRSDTDKDGRQRENCTAAGFSDVPADLDLKTKVLVLPNNLFSSLSWTSFQIFPEIYEIDLTANQVSEVTLTATPILPTLSVLWLGSNRLTSLSDGSFSACPSLTELYLNSNAISSLSNDTFSGLSKLEILDLTSNHITVLPDLMLHPLAAIETLYLENNQIKVMPDDWFSQKEEVPYLYLSANPWACSCSLSYLRRYLEDNELNVYVRDGKDIKGDVESVVCDSPLEHKGTPVISLEESDLCSPSTAYSPTGDFDLLMTTITPYKEITAAATIPSSTSLPIPSTSSLSKPSTLQTPFAVLHSGSYEVVTWSWYHTFTSLSKWSEVKTEKSSVRFHDLTTKRAETTSFVRLTPITPKLQVVTTEPTTTSSVSSSMSSTPSREGSEPASVHRHVRVSSVGAAGVFCVWLFAGCLLLCVASAVCVLVTLVKLVVWYKKVYKPLNMRIAKRSAGREGGMLLMHSRKEDKGVVALYRSVLFVHKEGGDAFKKEEESEGREEGGERQVITLKPTGGGGEKEGDDEGRKERGVYRKTVYRLLSKEEEIEGWRTVVEECEVSAEDGDRRRVGGNKEWSGGGGGGEGGSKKRYSVILREEREEAGGGREELDWVVGGWEVKRGGREADEEPRSSWGEWLAHYLPSMPWGVTMPPDDEAAM